MRFRRSLLRIAAKTSLQERGFEVHQRNGPGIIPGARLVAKKAKQTLDIGVRTSQDREVGLTRNQNGSWKTLGSVDWVLAAVPAEDYLNIEILCFEAPVVGDFFDAYVEANPSVKHLAPKLPVFVPLDDVRRGRPKREVAGLRRQCMWSKIMSPSALDGAPSSASAESLEQFTARVKEEFARRIGADVDDVTVAFGVKPK